MEVIERRRKEKKIYDLRKARGQCVKCKNLAIPGTTKCVLHTYRMVEYRRRWYERYAEEKKSQVYARRKILKLERRCRDCALPLIEGEGIFCVNCIISSNYPMGRQHETYFQAVTGRP